VRGRVRDSTYDPNDIDDNLSYDSDDDNSDDDDSNYMSRNDEDDASTDSTDFYSTDFSVPSTSNQPLPAPIPVKLGGVNDTGDRNYDPRNTGGAMETTGVDENTDVNDEKNENTDVNDKIENSDLEAYVRARRRARQRNS
jgi:hypothetical protein